MSMAAIPTSHCAWPRPTVTAEKTKTIKRLFINSGYCKPRTTYDSVSDVMLPLDEVWALKNNSYPKYIGT